MTSSFLAKPKSPCPRKPKTIILASLLDNYAEVVAKAVDLRGQGLTHLEVCEALNRLGYLSRTGKTWRHAQQIIKLLRSFDGEC